MSKIREVLVFVVVVVVVVLKLADGVGFFAVFAFFVGLPFSSNLVGGFWPKKSGGGQGPVAT